MRVTNNTSQVVMVHGVTVPAGQSRTIPGATKDPQVQRLIEAGRISVAGQKKVFATGFRRTPAQTVDGSE